MNILDTVGVPILDGVIGLMLRMLLATVVMHVLKIGIFFRGIPYIGVLGIFVFPTGLGIASTIGFYIIDVYATQKHITNFFKEGELNETSNKKHRRPSNQKS